MKRRGFLISTLFGTIAMSMKFGGCDPDDSLQYIKNSDAVFLTPNPGEIIKLPYHD